jgi:enamine deaminase RidA (YjgF/YER057c/UK114 family)
MSALRFHMIGRAPDPVAPFSHAVEADGWVFVTGQMPFTETSNTSAYPESIEVHLIRNLGRHAAQPLNGP